MLDIICADKNKCANLPLLITLVSQAFAHSGTASNSYSDQGMLIQDTLHRNQLVVPESQ